MKHDLIILLLIFFGTLALGQLLLTEFLSFAVESALLYLSAVIAASAFWIGRNK